MNSEPDNSEGDVNQGPARAQWVHQSLAPATRALIDEDARWFFHQSMSTPCLNALQSAQGAWMTDVQGRRILDFHGNSLHQLGYAHPRVVSAMQDTLHELAFCPRRYTNRHAIDLARRLCSAAPIPQAKALFAPGGTSAIGMALKLARVVTGRFKTISMWDSFHGASLDAISLGGEAVFRKNMGPLMSGAIHVPPCDPGACGWHCSGTCTLRCVEYIDYCMRKEGDVAAVVVETLRCTDVQIPPLAYYQELRSICNRHGALLILDEIPIALGRTGKLFAIEHYGIEPDILVLGKGLGGGTMPLAAMLARAEYDIAQGISLGHYTHEKSPVACAAGNAVLDALEQDGLLVQSTHKGQRLVEQLRQRTAAMACVKEVRGLGLLVGVELQDTPLRPAPALAEAVLYRCLSMGLSFKVGQGNVLVLCPPLTIEDADLAWAADCVVQALRMG